MLEPLRRVVVLTHLLPETTTQTLPELAECVARLGVELLLPPDEVAKHPGSEAWGYRQIDADKMSAADLCLVLGGDGTILRALGRMLGTGVPTLGINFGTVGFLASLDQRDWRQGLAETLAGKYQVVELLTVEARFQDRRFTGVNDVVLLRVEPRRVLHLEYDVSGTYVGDMFCDGMIIASPTGSTAYNLSCDGPLVVWDASVLVLNFIAPHSLGFRPVVLRPDHVISARNMSPLDEAEIAVDGDVVGRLRYGESVEMAASELRARLLVREGGTFYHNVEEKLFYRPGDAR
jgi:NAD+ kinase